MIRWASRVYMIAVTSYLILGYRWANRTLKDLLDES